MVLDVVRVFLKRIAELGAFRRFDDDRSFDQAAADSREFGLAMFGMLSGDERIGSDRLSFALALVPEFEEVAAFGMGLVPALDHDVIAADATLAVEQRRRESPRTINLDLL